MPYRSYFVDDLEGRIREHQRQDLDKGYLKNFWNGVCVVINWSIARVSVSIVVLNPVARWMVQE